MSRFVTVGSIYAFCLFSGLALTGCSGSFGAQPSSLANAPAGMISGKVIGGQNPVSGAKVSVYQVGTTGYGLGAAQLGTSVVTGTDGGFSFPANNYTCPFSNTPTYIVATGGNPGSGINANVALMAVLGTCSQGKNETVIMNEVTTAAAVTAVGQFMNTTLGAGVTPTIGGTCTGCAAGVYNKGLVNAMTVTYPQLVNNGGGSAVANSIAGTLTITTEAAKLNTFANVLAACVNSQGTTSTTETTTLCGKLFTDSNALGATPRPADTIQAGLMMALYPYYNAVAEYGLASSTSPFLGLTQAPMDWTLAISYKTTTLGLGILQNTSSNLDIDANGNIWFPSNKSPGGVGLANFSPSTTTFSTAVGASGLKYPQYVAIDTSAAPMAWTTDLTGSLVVGVPVGTGSTKSLTGVFSNGGPIAVDGFNSITLFGATGGVYKDYFIDTARAVMTNPSSSGNFVGLPTGIAVPVVSVYVYPGESLVAESNSAGCYLEEFDSNGALYPYSQTGTATCASGGALQAYIPSAGITLLFAAASTTNQIYDDYTNTYNSYAGLVQPEGVVLDGAGNLWVANAGKPSVSVIDVTYTVDSRGYTVPVFAVPDVNAYQHGTTYGNTMTAPYGIGVDGSGNVWVSNASCVSTNSTACSATSFTLSEMVGAAAPTNTPSAAEGLGVHMPTN